MSESKHESKTALLMVASLLGVLALALLGAILGRGWIMGNVVATPAPTTEPQDIYRLKKLEFPGLSAAQRDAFNVGVTHENTLREWWYLNAHLYDQRNNRYTLMIAMLKDGRLFGILAEHVAKTTIPIVMPQTTSTLDSFARVYSVGPAILRQPDPDLLCYEFDYDLDDLKLDLTTCANKAPLVVNGTGEVRMGEKGHSWYYSITNANIKGMGRLGEKEVQFTGRAWLDRQWGNWFQDDFDKWDWYSLQLDGDIELLLFVFWKDGRIIHQFGDVYLASGTTAHNLKYDVTPTSTWYSSKTGITWETSWMIDIPQYRAHLSVTADYPDHEIDDALWEGGVEIGGKWLSQPVTGRGFFEARRRGKEESGGH